MIDYIKGKVAYLHNDYAVVEVHGVGYRVFCSNPYALQGQMSEEVTVYTHHHVREDAILLFGFPTREEQTLFRKLLDVSGIGPRVALGILSGAAPDAVIAAVQQEDLGFLTRLPGIGKKTAQRIVLDLKDKLGPVLPRSVSAAAASAPVERGGPDGAWSEAAQGLKALGFSDAEIERAAAAIHADGKPGDTADIWMKRALRQLDKG